MKELVKNSRVTGYLEKIYRELNKDKFNGELEECVITVQSSKGAYGHVTCSRVWIVNKADGEAQRYELNIGAETLNRPIENVVSTMLHEMVHIYNLMHDIQDCSRGNTYHNKRFKEKAESVGLQIDYDKRIGWSITSPTEELLEYIIEKGWSEILLNRNSGITFLGGSTGGHSANTSSGVRKPSSTRKYQCPCCGLSVRATRAVKIICAECAEMLEVV